MGDKDEKINISDHTLSAVKRRFCQCMINYIKLGCSKNVEINGFTNTIDAAIYDFPNAINKIAGYTAVRLDLTVTINHNIFASEGFMKINECCYRCPCDFTPTKLIFNV